MHTIECMHLELHAIAHDRMHLHAIARKRTHRGEQTYTTLCSWMITTVKVYV